MDKEPGAPVAVVPTTPNRRRARYIALLILAVSSFLQAGKEAEPQIALMFPQAHWIAPTLATVGFFWLAIQRIAEEADVAEVNYSSTGDAPKTG